MTCEAATKLAGDPAPRVVDPRSGVLLCGEDNPYGSDQEFALYCAPRGCSGDRLRQILGLSEDDYLALRRTNLCASEAWSMREARRRAELIVTYPGEQLRVCVLLGRKVADAFGYELPFFTAAIEPLTAAWPEPITLVSLPHPSGRNASMWTDGARQRARDILRELVTGVAWGSV